MLDLPPYQQLFEACPHPYLVLRADTDFGIVAVNDRYLEATGTRREAIVGHGLFEIFPDNPDETGDSAVGDLRASLLRVLGDRRPDVMGVQKYDIPRRDGSDGFELKYWSPVNTPVFSAGGEVAYIIHHVEDVTEFIVGRERASRENAEQLGKVEARAERMEAEVMRRSAEVKEANRALKTAMAELERRETELAALNQRLTELDRLKSQFFANVSHELRTPLTLILAPLERRLQRPGAEPGEQRETELMLRNARLLYRHVADLLDAAKLEAGGMTLAWTELDLAALVRTMASHFESLAEERAIAYRINTPPRLTVQGDAEKLQRVLLNLLSNAFKFTPDTGGIMVRLTPRADAARIEVLDTGPGIPAEMRQAVFERFRQVEGGTQRHHGGTGLGLSIVKDFVELHGGSVVAEAGPGGGALFRVELPLAAPAGAVLGASTTLDAVLDRQAVEELGHPATDAAPAAVADTRTPLVLVVEDNADMNAFIADALRPHYRVATAGDGRQGLAMARTLLPDLILSDVMMPLLSGDELVAELRRHTELAGTPIVMLTARADEALRVRLLQSGVQDFINKPFSVNELLARVDGLLAERRRTGDQLAASEARYRELVENANSAILHWSPDGRISFCNEFAQRFFGWPAEEIVGQHVGILVPERESTGADLSGLVADVAAAPERYLSTVNENICRDGRRVWMNWTNRASRDAQGRVTGILAIGNDITERKRAEDELKQRNDELERFNQASVGREMQMIALKRQINALAAQLGQTPPYDLGFADNLADGEAFR